MKTFAKISAISLIAAAAGLTAIGVTASPGERGEYREYERGERGEYCERGAKRGHHKMKHGYRQGADRDLDLTADEVKTLVSARLIMHGNDRLKVGKVVSKGDDDFLVDIVTTDGSLVKQIEVDGDEGLKRGPIAILN